MSDQPLDAATVIAQLKEAAVECRRAINVPCQVNNEWHADQYEQWATEITRLSAAHLRSVFTNEVIHAIGALARQQNVCREQGGTAVFVTGMEAAREYIIEQLMPLPSPPPPEKT